MRSASARVAGFCAAIAFLCCSLAGSARAAFPNLPVRQVGQSSSINSGTSTCVFGHNVLTGNFEVVSTTYETTTNLPAYTHTQSGAFNLDKTDVSNTVKVAVASATIGSSGADTITSTIASGHWQNTHCVEYWAQGLTVTVDNSAVSATASAGATYTSPSVMATLNGDLIYSAIGGDSSTQSFIAHSPAFTLSSFGGADGGAQAFAIAGVNGSYNVVWQNDSAQTILTAATVAYKSAAGIIITSPTALPDGALSTAYDYALLAQGGVGAYTWSITSGSLQSGLSLNSSTGEITGTPTSGPQNSITFHVTDGTNTADLNATLKVATSMNISTFVQGKSCSGSGACAFTSSPTSGNLLAIGMGSAFPGGYSVPLCDDSLGTDFRPLATGGQTSRSTSVQAIMTIMAGAAPSTGADSVTCPGISAGTVYSISEYANAASFGGDNTIQTGTQSTSPLTSGTFTPLVPGEVVLAEASSASSGPAFTVSGSLTTTGGANNNPASGYQILTTVTGYTFSFTFSGSCGSGNACGLLAAGFRPTGGSAAPGGGIPSYKLFIVGNEEEGTGERERVANDAMPILAAK